MPDEQDELIKQTNQELQDTEFRLGYGEEMAKVDFALALTKARKAHNITQHQLAEMLGVRQPYIAKLERGEANPTIAAAGRIFAAMRDRLCWTTGPLAPETNSTAIRQMSFPSTTTAEASPRRSWADAQVMRTYIYQPERSSRAWTTPRETTIEVEVIPGAVIIGTADEEEPRNGGEKREFALA